LAGEDDATVIHQIINSEHKEALNNLAQLWTHGKRVF
jgi:hypothetical protein